MSNFKILNEQRFPLNVAEDKIESTISGWNLKNANKDLLPYWRWEHRVTLGWHERVFIVFVDQLNSSMHIEEIETTSGTLQTISDDTLFEALLNFAQSKGFCGMLSPLIKPRSERFV